MTDRLRWEDQLNKQLPGLRRYAHALTQNSQIADDLVQDCLEKSWSKRKTFKEGTNLRAWLFSIMHNLFISSVRRNKLADDYEKQLATNTAIHNMASEHNHVLHDLSKCLARLKPEHREVLILAGLENMPYKEIAEITETPIGTVMSRLSRGREELRQLMDESKEPRLVRVK